MPKFNLNQKAIDCLEMSESLHIRPAGSQSWQVLYAAACGKYSEKAVCAKFNELCGRDYMDCGVSARTGWLTDKGKLALSEWRSLHVETAA